MDNHFTYISPEHSFRFSCGPHIACFNECCRDLNQFLTPYDILRLKTNLRISSGEFLKRYTTQHIGPESGLPVIRLKEKHEDALKCPFVTEEGCSVYPDRPSSCRAYPIARAIFRDRKSGRSAEHFILISEPHCKGFQSNKSQSVRQWIINQGLLVYNEMNDLMMEIISHKNRSASGPLDLKAQRLFHMACYDLDDFRDKIFNKGNLEPHEYGDSLLLKSTTEETALLKISLKWVQKMIFNRNP